MTAESITGQQDVHLLKALVTNPDRLLFNFPNSKNNFDRHAPVRKNKLCRHFLSYWRRIYRPSGFVPSVSLCEGGGDVIKRKQNSNLTWQADQEEPGEESSFRKSCKMQE